MSCSVCSSKLPKDDHKYLRWTCCGHAIHKQCTESETLKDYSSNNNCCPFCKSIYVAPKSQNSLNRVLNWVQKGEAWAMCMLGEKYEHGGEGVAQSYEQAATYYQAAASLGYATAQFNMGSLYYDGEGVNQSYERAELLWEMAVLQGVDDAKYNLSELFSTRRQSLPTNKKKPRRSIILHTPPLIELKSSQEKQKLKRNSKNQSLDTRIIDLLQQLKGSNEELSQLKASLSSNANKQKEEMKRIKTQHIQKIQELHDRINKLTQNNAAVKEENMELQKQMLNSNEEEEEIHIFDSVQDIIDVTQVTQETEKVVTQVRVTSEKQKVVIFMSKINAFIIKNKLSMQKIFEEIDTSGNNMLDVIEFRLGLRNILKQVDSTLTKEDYISYVIQLFNRCDKDGSLEIDYHEFEIELQNAAIEFPVEMKDIPEIDQSKKEIQHFQSNNTTAINECSICHEELPKLNSKLTRMTCCGEALHLSCYDQLRSKNRMYRKACPLCNELYPTTPKQRTKRLFKFVDGQQAWAEGMLGQKYRDGIGVHQSYKRAIELYHLAVLHGDAEAQLNLGYLYERGQGGLVQSEKKANELYVLAADQGHSTAQYNLGIKFTKMEGAMGLAKAWLLRAANNAQEYAIVALRHIDKMNGVTISAEHKEVVPTICAYCLKSKNLIPCTGCGCVFYCNNKFCENRYRKLGNHAQEICLMLQDKS